MTSMFDATLHRTEVLAEELVERLRSAGLTVATAESLTAGLCAASIAAVPGASAVLRGGLVVYATDLKHGLAGVSARLLDERGPVDPDVARELAAGAVRQCSADVGLSLTGVAGPDPQEGHPVGEVYVGVSLCGHQKVEKLQLERDIAQMNQKVARQFIRYSAVNLALSTASNCLEG